MVTPPSDRTDLQEGGQFGKPATEKANDHPKRFEQPDLTLQRTDLRLVCVIREVLVSSFQHAKKK